MQNSQSILEIACSSVLSARLALANGANRLELCSALNMGGLTPSRPLLEAVLKEAGSTPIRVLIRCRGGGFEYAAEELDLMASEIRNLADLPLDGFVVGALRDGLPDPQALRAFRLAAGQQALTFHRAFDDCLPQASKALRRLQDHGFDRILTAGGPGKAIKYKPILQKLVEEAAAFDIKIIAGGGVRSYNLAELKELRGLVEFHSAATLKASNDPRWPKDPIVDPEEVARMRKVLEDYSAANS